MHSEESMGQTMMVEEVSKEACKFEVCTLCDSVGQPRQKYPEKIFAEMVVQDRSKSVRFQVDTGAWCNVIPLKDLDEQGKIVPSEHKLRLYDGTIVTPLGHVTLTLTNSKTRKAHRCEFTVVQEAPVSLLGARSSQEMHLVDKDMTILSTTFAGVRS